ncbi:nitric oxide synthase-interacting protein [Trichonephila clavata]|uniref:Nitric oxide synthase-interacting protein n=1 Tax=Trichonephila clavata TaxID=2740835 RepID=A0A8X6FY71_TRICU|nr:nitric oxide synthase-interacting protein [Trichonephila clavata]
MSGHASSSTAGRKGHAAFQKPIGKDSVKDFNYCCLTLKPCTNPVITPFGFLYDKRAILDYIRMKKKEAANRIKEEEARWKEKCGKEPKPFYFVHDGIDAKPHYMPTIYIPMSRKDRFARIENSVSCPMSGQSLKVRDLIEVHFVRVYEPLSPFASKVRYMCAVTHEVLDNSVPMVVLRTSGNVVTMKCVNELIKKDMIDPTNGEPLNEEDIIPLKRLNLLCQQN